MRLCIAPVKLILRCPSVSGRWLSPVLVPVALYVNLTVVTPPRVLAVQSSAGPRCPLCLRDSASEAQRDQTVNGAQTKQNTSWTKASASPRCTWIFGTVHLRRPPKTRVERESGVRGSSQGCSCLNLLLAAFRSQ